MARTKHAARMATGMRAPRCIAPYKQCSDAHNKSSGRTYEPVDDQLVDAKAAGSAGYLLRAHSRDFVQVTHTEAGERFWVQVVKRKLTHFCRLAAGQEDPLLNQSHL